jgi:heme/copper-type cytochrome/quinol oxidase subunit 3
MTRTQLVPSPVLAMLIFVITELMFFAGFVSAFTIMRGSAVIWPPLDQPRLPIGQTAFNSALLLASGLLLYVAGRRQRARPDQARRLLLGAIALGAGFVVLQGREWVQLLAQGLTLRSSALGSFFYMIVGTHALHALVALGVLGWFWLRLGRAAVPRATLAAAEIFWYFVVGVWPVLYWRVYLA